MELLQAGVDRAVIALWLGHESVETTQIYLDADLALKEKVLATTNPIKGKFNRYRPDDKLLAFLKGAGAAHVALPESDRSCGQTRAGARGAC
jgi:integrase/recombinase XerD